MPQHNDSQPHTPLRLLATRKAGHSALIVTVCILVWAITTSASGYFWPAWVILVAALSFLAQVGKAALGNTKQREKLEHRYGNPR